MTKALMQYIRVTQLTDCVTDWNVPDVVATAAAPISEDLVRQSLIDAIELVKKASTPFFKLNQAAQIMHIHIEQRLNAELKALLVGDLSYYRGKA